MSFSIFFAASFLFFGHATANCLPAPVVLTVGNVSTSPQGHTRGVRMDIGNPPQAMAFDVYLLYNNTVLWDNKASCGSDSSASCAAQHGGHYDSSKSSSAKTYSKWDAAGGSPNDGLPINDTSIIQWTDDTVKFNANAVAQNVPLASHHDPIKVNWGSPNPMALIGLGANSSLMNSLKESKMINSSVFSYYWGLTGENAVNQADGSLVLGGFDAAKVAGQPSYNFTIPSTPGSCSQGIPLVGIQQLNAISPNGNKKSIFGGARSAGITACIDPSSPTLLTLPYDPVYTGFEAATGMYTDSNQRSTGTNFWSVQITNDSAEIFPGGLQIVLDNGLDVTVPNDQLIQPTWDIDNNGKYFQNNTYPTLLINSLQSVNENDTSILGRNFLSSVYMMVNHKKNQVTLWPVKRTSDTQYVAVDDDGNIQHEVCSPNANNGATVDNGNSGNSNNGNNDPVDDGNMTQNKVSGGTIAGAVVGSIAGVALIAAAALFFLRRRKRSSAGVTGVAGAAIYGSATKEHPEFASHYGPSAPTGYKQIPISELHDNSRAAELDANHTPLLTQSQEPQELPTTRS